MQRRVRVAAPEGLHQGGGHVIHGVSALVIAHGAALGHLLGVGDGEDQGPVLHLGGLIEQLHRVHGLPHVPTAGVGNVVGHSLLPPQGERALLPHQTQGPLHGGADLIGGDGLELKDRAPAEEGGVDVEIGVLRGGGDEGDGPVLHKLQEGLLLLLVEVLDLVQVQQHAAGGHHGPHIPDDVLDVLEGGGGGVELVEGAVGPLGNDVGDGGLPGTGGAVEDHVGVGPLLNEPAQQGVGAQQMLLTHDLVDGLRADTIRQGTIHRAPPFLPVTRRPQASAWGVSCFRPGRSGHSRYHTTTFSICTEKFAVVPAAADLIVRPCFCSTAASPLDRPRNDLIRYCWPPMPATRGHPAATH